MAVYCGVKDESVNLFFNIQKIEKRVDSAWLSYEKRQPAAKKNTTKNTFFARYYGAEYQITDCEKSIEWTCQDAIDPFSYFKYLRIVRKPNQIID